VNQREYERLKAQAQAEYQRTVEAIERVWEMTGGSTKNGSAPAEAGPRRGSVKMAVQQAVQSQLGPFSLRDIERFIQNNNPLLSGKIKRPSLSSALKRLEKDKEIVLVAAGSGKRASTFRRAG
jgi:hypothetical protein